MSQESWLHTATKPPMWIFAALAAGFIVDYETRSGFLAVLAGIVAGTLTGLTYAVTMPRGHDRGVASSGQFKIN